MVRSIVSLSFFIFTLATSTGEDFKFPIYRRVSGYDVTNTWFVLVSRLEKLPKWNERDEPPLSVGKAMLLAKAWVVSKDFNTNCYVGSVEFRSVARGTPPVPPNKLSGLPNLRPCWFYIIHFEEVAMVGSWATCVVLPDGSIVEPECSPNLPDSKRVLRYLD
jgi:hypothetical protein